MAKLWGGRFQKSTDKKVDDFNSSIRFDKRMYKQDIKGSVAHATMLGRQNIIPKEDSDKIVAELKNILNDIEDCSWPVCCILRASSSSDDSFRLRRGL